MATGRKPLCGGCGTCQRCKNAAWQRAWAERNREMLRERYRQHYRKNADMIRERVKDWRQRNIAQVREADRKRGFRESDPIKTFARKQARRLERQPCEVCGAFPADAHHDDYSRPLDVRWLCEPHHGEVHRRVA